MCDSVCEWHGQSGDMHGNYETSCGNMHTLSEGNISDNGYKFCPYCGCEIVANEADYSDL